MTRLLPAAMLAACAHIAACGGARTPPQHRLPPPRVGSGSATGGESGPVATADERPTDSECDAMLAHALTVEQSERPVDQRLAEPELAQVRATLRERELPGCRLLARPTYQCLLAATTTADLASCR